MAGRSAIEWTDATWTPIRAANLGNGKVGWHCEHATTGCEFCYAETLNKRLGTGLPFKPGHRKDIRLFLDEKMLLAPLRYNKPRMIFVCSMTDLFADFVPDEWIDRIFAVMALCPQHTFQVLTKRAGRMRDYLSHIDAEFHADPDDLNERFGEHCVQLTGDPCSAGWFEDHVDWPLPNVWLGVSTERQKEADERIPLLLQTPAAVRFISAEPLLGPLHIEPYMPHGKNVRPAWSWLDWVIAGGESGHDARPMHPDWARTLRDQCAAAGVPYFFKQWGAWAPSTPEQAAGNPRSGWCALREHPRVARAEELYPEVGAAFLEHFGKKASGRLLDGITHDAMPEIAG